MNEEILLDLEGPLRKLSCAVNAIELMVYGMSRVMDPYADGFYAVWNALREAEQEIEEAISSGKE